MAEGLVGGEAFAVDASVIKAEANRTRGVPGTVARRDPKQATRAVTQYLATLEQQATSITKNVSLTDSRGLLDGCTRRSRVLCVRD